MTLRIVQLHPTLLGVTGDRGNVDVLAYRASARGLDVTVDRYDAGEGDLAGAQVIVIGNGPLSAMRAAREDLLARRDALAAHLDAGGVLLAVGGGAELLSAGVTVPDGEDVQGLGLLPFASQRTRNRRVGYIVADSEYGRVIGFEDHASDWTPDAGAAAWAKVVAGTGSVVGGGEGIRSRNAFATNVQGPLLPLNPALADALLQLALGEAQLPGTADGLADVDRFAAGARAKVEQLQNSHFTSMKL